MLMQIVLDSCKEKQEDCDNISTGMWCMFQECFSVVLIL